MDKQIELNKKLLMYEPGLRGNMNNGEHTVK